MSGIEEKVNNSMGFILVTLSAIKGENHNLKVDDLKSANKIISPISFFLNILHFKKNKNVEWL